MALGWRAITEFDLEQCLVMDPRSLGDAIVGRHHALTIWRGLLRNQAFNAAMVEADGRETTRRVVCFGASIFVNSDFTNRELRNPAPDINSRVFAEIRGEKLILHCGEGLSWQRDSEGLDLLLLSSSFSLSTLTAFEKEEAAALLPRALVHLHDGYPIKRIIMETTSERMRLLALNSGIWKMVGHFPEEERALMVVTREEALGAAGFSLLGPLFCHKKAKLELRDAEKQLLCEAMHGATDFDLAPKLGLSLSSVKKRWSTLYTRIATVMPELLPDADSELLNETRGAQKRHRVLAYMRDHAEELRPFRWYPYSAVAKDVQL